MTIFEQEGDFAAFEQVLLEAVERTETRLLAYSLMPNHWHLVVWPRKDGELSRFVGWLTLTHTQRWHAHRHSTGTGHVYQGRFKSFPIQEDEHFYTVARYVERNPLRADLVRKPLPLAAGIRRGQSAAGPLAPLAQSGLGGTCESTIHGSGVTGSAPQRGARQAIRRHGLERSRHPTARTRINRSSPRKTQTSPKRFLTPFVVPFVVHLGNCLSTQRRR
jgi:REP element-mobilizing transposase RayT